MTPPKINELRLRNAPCFLWDPDRLRIVWANAAGLAFFGAETLFDLIDRRFDASEPGPQRVRALRKELEGSDGQKTELAFPSSGANAKFTATCHLEPLADGRSGVLVVGDEPPVQQGLQSGALAEIFQAMPAATVVVDPEDVISFSNSAAAEFVDHLAEPKLSALFGDAAKAKDFVTRVARAGTVSEIHSIKTKLGVRELRMTAQRIARKTNGQSIVVILEDITERRALERSLAGKPAPAPQPAPPASHPTTSQPARAETPLVARTRPPVAEKQPAAIAALPVEAAPLPQAVRPAGIPPVVRKRLEGISGGIIILRGGDVLHATAGAFAMLGVSDLDELRSFMELAKLPSLASPATIDAGHKGRMRLEFKTSEVPWVSGFATQIHLLAAKLESEPQANPSGAVAEEDVPPSEAIETAKSSSPVAAPGIPAANESWKLNDAELSTILDTASDGIIVLDDEGLVRSFSGGAEAIFGQRKAEVLGEPFTNLLMPESRKIIRDYLAALSDSGLAAVFNDGREVLASAGPGRILPLFITISRFEPAGRSKAKKTRGFSAVVRDITQWKQTEQELREAKEKAEHTSAQKSEFLARISHELRTPLNAILGFSEVMRLERFGRINNEKYRGYVSDIYASGAHLLSLINDLLDLSKVEAGKLELNFTSVNLADVTEHAMRLLADRAQQARVILRKTFPADLPNVVADLRSMRQIMLNLLSNAIKFTDAGGQVIVSARLNQAGELVLRVKDTGVGMTEEEVKDALEPFRRVTSDSRPDVEGTGLGLPLTKALTEANRARFWLSSEPGKGTLVEIVYPSTRVLV